MKELLNKEYFHFGTDKIKRELWLNLHILTKYPNYMKPLGGLWCSNQNNYILCDWLMYIEDMSELKDGYDYDDYVCNKNSSLIKFKNNAKLLTINNKNDFKNLRDSGLIKKLKVPIRICNDFDFIYVDEIPDYEKIKKLYDLLYVNSYADKSLYQYSIITMLAINPDVIEYYKPLKCDYLERKIIEVGEKETINDLSSNYLLLVKFIRQLIVNDMNILNNDIYEVRKQMINELMTNKNIINLIPNDIDKKHALEVAIINTYNEIRDEKKLVLHN